MARMATYRLELNVMHQWQLMTRPCQTGQHSVGIRESVAHISSIESCCSTRHGQIMFIAAWWHCKKYIQKSVSI